MLSTCPTGRMTTRRPSSFDLHMMSIALAMARRGLGQTAPNPAVGAVIADEATGETVARGWTQRGGRPHAETEAIRRAGAGAAGKTMYVTLEPCSHHGRTPPCADAIIAAGIRRVVAAIEDPDPRVSGRGLARLRAAGIEVERGVRAPEARWVTRGHIVRLTERRPLVTIKVAAAADGSVPRGGAGQPAWVTGPDARAAGQMLRAEADAILVGGGTVRDDDPALTCRLPGLADRSPVRVVLSSGIEGLARARLFSDTVGPPVWLFSRRPAAGAADRISSPVVGRQRSFLVPEVTGRLWLPAVMEQLVAEGITRLLVEGGPTVWRAFADARLVDAVHLFQARGSASGDAAARERSARATLSRLLGDLPLALADHRAIGADHHFEFRLVAGHVESAAAPPILDPNPDQS